MSVNGETFRRFIVKHPAHVLIHILFGFKSIAFHPVQRHFRYCSSVLVRFISVFTRLNTCFAWLTVLRRGFYILNLLEYRITELLDDTGVHR